MRRNLSAYDAQNVNLDGNTGDLDIQMQTTELVRASDLPLSTGSDNSIDFEQLLVDNRH